jgi:hypothetical protein
MGKRKWRTKVEVQRARSRLLRGCRVIWTHMTSGDRLRSNEVRAMIGPFRYDLVRARACNVGMETCDSGTGICATPMKRRR